MSTAYQIVVCGSAVLDPLQTLELAHGFAIGDLEMVHIAPMLDSRGKPHLPGAMLC